MSHEALRRLRALRSERDPALRHFFAPGEPVFVASAPGRLDVMGGIADYSGSLVLQLPLAVHTTAMLQLQQTPSLDVVSVRHGHAVRASLGLDDFLHAPDCSPAGLARRFAAGSDGHWASYVFGVAHACLVRGGARVRDVTRGFRLLVESDVPEGKGVSSSAALEVSALAVIAAAYGAGLGAEALAAAAQWAENHVAGAPCGIMDQVTSACGRRDHLLRLRCQPAVIEGHVPIPAGYRLYGIDSGLRHAVAGSDYGSVRTAAFMGYRIIAALAGLPAGRDGAVIRVHDERWHGYLANIPLALFGREFAPALPERMLGAHFLARHGGLTDTVTRVDPARWYAVRVATAHPVHENARVERFAELLASLAETPSSALEMGALMAASHASYGACGLGSDGTDRLVALVAAAGPGRGLYGAKITGGGSGGTIAVLASSEAETAVRAIASQYAREAGRGGAVFAGSGPGMAEGGVLELVMPA